MITCMKTINTDLQSNAIIIDHYEVNGPFADSYAKDW